MRWAASLGLLALVLNAAVPVHLAFDLAAALTQPPAAEHAGHDHHHDHHHHHSGTPPDHPVDHGNACQFCAAVVSLAGFAVAAPVLLPLPVAAAAPPTGATVARFALKDAPAAYRSRAPPIV